MGYEIVQKTLICSLLVGAHVESFTLKPISIPRLRTSRNAVEGEKIEVDTNDEVVGKMLEQGMSDAQVKSRMASFNVFDRNQDGVVDMRELKDGLFEKFGTKASEDEIKSAVEAFDVNKNGVLEPNEFVLGQIKRLIETRQDDERNAAAEAKRQELAAKRIEEAGGPIPAAIIEANTDTSFGTRAAACVPYMLPLVDASAYGFSLLAQAPVASAALIPFVALFRAIPFSGFIAFLFMSQQARNPSNPALLRFNLQQAILLDISLFVPQLLGSLLPLDPQLKQVAEPAGDAVFLIFFGMIAYCWITNLATGRFPNKIPIISDAAERVTGPQDE